MKHFVFTKTVSASVMTFLLAACGQEAPKSLTGESATTVPGASSEAEDLASCEFRLDHGSKAGTAPTETLVPDYFAQTYSSGHLKNVANASAEQTIGYIESIGPKIYRIESSQRPCKMFSSLTMASSEMQKIWVGPGSDAKLGSYYPTQAAIPETKAYPIILLREDANRWHLVHEFMHHLFELGLNAKNMSAAKVTSAVSQMEAELKTAKEAYASSKNDVTGNALVNALFRYFSVLDFKVTTTTLEEMSIETILITQVKSGEITNVPKAEFARAANYAITSGEAANAFYATTLSTLSDLAVQTDFKVSATSALQVQNMKTHISERQKTIKELTDLAQPYRQKSATVSGVADGAQVQDHLGCDSVDLEGAIRITGEVTELFN